MAVLNYVLVFSEGEIISLFSDGVRVAKDRRTLLSLAKEVDQEFESNNVNDAIQTIAEHCTEMSCKDCPEFSICECWG